jgi:7-cyano-7-deazaguanosine (preQ0) biosynthesis protein QueE
MTDTLVVSEVFGPTWQGEGPSLGRRCGFVRLGRCNLACTWCDTPFTWDWERFDPAEELHRLTVTEVVSELDAMVIEMLVISGGEPLLQQSHLPPLLTTAKQRGWWIEVETAGTLAPTSAVDAVDRFNVSPKLASSGNPHDRRYKPHVLRTFEASGRAAFKFVACGETDLDEIAAIIDDCGLTNVWVMPEGTDAAMVTERARRLAPSVLERGWNFTTRLHVLLWDDKRGV